MTIINGYTTLQRIKDRLNPSGLTTSATDDSFIEGLVENASRFIDAQCGGRTFYARTETRYYDTPCANDDGLFIGDDDILTVTTLTNGGGDAIASTAYKLYPLNSNPKHTIKLLGSSGIAWEYSDDGDPEGAITVAGTWGYSATAPHDIREACEAIVVRAYQGRRGDGQQGQVSVTASGVVITPQDVPDTAWATIGAYKRVV